MKKLLICMMVLLISFSAVGCGGYDIDSEKCAKMALEYFENKTGIKFSSEYPFEKCYVVKNASPKDYTYYSPSKKEEVTEFKDIIARVYAYRNDDVRFIIFVKNGAESAYDKNGVSDDCFGRYLIASEQQIRDVVYKNESVTYPEAVSISMWKEEKAKQDVYIPTREELNEADIISPDTLFKK